MAGWLGAWEAGVEAGGGLPRGDGGALPSLPKGSKPPTDEQQRPFPGPEQAPTKVGKDSGVRLGAPAAPRAHRPALCVIPTGTGSRRALRTGPILLCTGSDPPYARSRNAAQLRPRQRAGHPYRCSAVGTRAGGAVRLNPQGRRPGKATNSLAIPIAPADPHTNPTRRPGITALNPQCPAGPQNRRDNQRPGAQTAPPGKTPRMRTADVCTEHSDKGSIPAWAGETHPPVTSPECARTATDPSQTAQKTQPQAVT